MSNLKLPQFGKMQHTENSCPISETPVTRLSRILSKARYVVRSVADWIPADIDESANQEAPTTTNVGWLLGYPFTDTQETSRSHSSGYNSSSITRSAPQLSGSIVSYLLFNGSILQSSNSHVHTSETSPGKRSESVEKPPVTQSASVIECRQSLGSRGWLKKREKRRRWPQISGISTKFSRNNIDSSFDETNSCPAAIFTSYSTDINTPEVRVPLSDKKEGKKSFGCSSTDGRGNMFMMEKLCSPVAKRRRIESPNYLDKPLTCSVEIHSLDDTVPIEVDSVPSDPEDKSLAFLRLHSTPTLSKRPLVVSSVTPLICPKIHSFSYGTKQPETKPGLSRCISVPLQGVETTLPVPKVDHHHSSLLGDDSWASVLRPRALPVIDRTASGLHCVSPDVIAKLVRGNGKRLKKYQSYRNIQHVIIDCRFPYEYEGGHINGAINIFTHSDLVQEIFNRVPAQRPPGAAGPPKLLGDGLARRLAATMKEPLSAPCELASPETESDANDDCEEADEGQEESWVDEEAEEDQTGSADHIEQGSSSSYSSSSNADGEPLAVSESEPSSGSSRKSCHSVASNSTVDLTGSSSHDLPAFVVIFHCEFSSQRAPDLAAFLRNVDRLSNYHRYPFLYFPEIYIMKGGYSAFYKKYPRLCCPKQYVKMFNRDYREHLRLYRRLTKRVSSACLACIRPQQGILVNSGNPPPEADGETNECGLEPIFGLDFSCNTTFAVRPPLLPSPCSAEKKTSYTSGPWSRSKNQASGAKHYSMLDCETDKEKILIGPSDNTFELKSPLSEGVVDDTALHELNDNLKVLLQSPVDCRLSSVSSSHDRTTGSDSPLGVAEAVVRAGHLVMVSTLKSAAPSAEVVEALDIFHRRATLPIPVELKRANTVVGMFREANQNFGGRKRPTNNPGRDLLPLSNLENLETPMAGRLKRANTLGCHLSLEMMQRETTGVLTDSTPILNFTQQKRDPMDSPTVDYDVCGKYSP